MHQITLSNLRSLATPQQAPCISLYQPTHRQFPDSRENPVRYRNLLRQLESTLSSRYASTDYQPLVDKFRALIDDTTLNPSFWNHRTEGLAILASPEQFSVFDLQRDVPELVVVADSFHLKPLFRILQSADRFQILALDRGAVKLYEGNRYAIDQVDLADEVPATLEAALGSELTEPYVNVASHGGPPPGRGPRAASGTHHGYGDKKEEIKLDVERFFRIVAREIEQHHSNPTGLPLLLAALPEYHATFRKFSQNRHLMDEGLMFHPESVEPDQLLAEAWKLIEPRYLERLAGLTDRYQAAKARGHATDELEPIAQAVVAGRIDLLLVEADRVLRGHIDPMSGKVTRKEESAPGYDDLLDDLAEGAFRMDAEVIVVPAERMPTTTGAAAVMRV